jgi:ABC-type branched-subunit amino acid transport system permease subunit
LIFGVDGSVVMAAGYAVFLGLAAFGLELIARQSHRRAEQFHVIGFRFDAALDAWHCPTGKRLHRAEVRHGGRTVLYRAPAHHCNSCHIKARCTDSENGRTIERRLDSWLDSEIRRFHIGISLALLLLAALILAVEMVVHRRESDELILAVALAVVALPGARIAVPFFNRADHLQQQSESNRRY